MIQKLPFDKLRVVPINDLLLHEKYDPRRVVKLRAKLKGDGVLKDPIMAVKHENQFIVLDGATRTQALIEIGVPKIVVQLVNYETTPVQLKHWCHLLRGIDSQELVATIQEITGTKGIPFELDQLEASLSAKRSSLGIVTDRGQDLSFNCSRDLDSQLPLLNRVVDIYSNDADVHRISEHDMVGLQRRFPDLSAVILFPSFHPSEVIHCALNSRKIPAGITRHLIDSRVTGLNIPLSWLD